MFDCEVGFWEGGEKEERERERERERDLTMAGGTLHRHRIRSVDLSNVGQSLYSSTFIVLTLVDVIFVWTNKW